MEVVIYLFFLICMATNKIFELLRDLKLDRTWVAQQLNQVRDDINGFNQRIKDQTSLQLSLNVGNLKAKLDDVKAQIKLAKEQGNRDAVISLTADSSRIQNHLLRQEESWETIQEPDLLISQFCEKTFKGSTRRYSNNEGLFKAQSKRWRSLFRD